VLSSQRFLDDVNIKGWFWLLLERFKISVDSVLAVLSESLLHELGELCEAVRVVGETELVTVSKLVKEAFGEFTKLVKEAFGENCKHTVYADFKPLEEEPEPAFYIHVIEKPL
jgi:hypothetical protein